MNLAGPWAYTGTINTDIPPVFSLNVISFLRINQLGFPGRKYVALQRSLLDIMSCESREEQGGWG